MSEIDTSPAAVELLAAEYRATMPHHVLQQWGEEAAATLRALEEERTRWYAEAELQRIARLSAEADRDAARAEVADLKVSVIAFAAPWAVEYAREWGLPKGHLHPDHYDLLQRCGARMDDFTRAVLPKKEEWR